MHITELQIQLGNTRSGPSKLCIVLSHQGGADAAQKMLQGDFRHNI